MKESPQGNRYRGGNNILMSSKMNHPKYCFPLCSLDYKVCRFQIDKSDDQYILSISNRQRLQNKSEIDFCRFQIDKIFDSTDLSISNRQKPHKFR